MPIIRPSTASDTSASKIAEQRVREWTLNLEAQRKKAGHVSWTELPAEIHPYVAISREAGAGGAELARKVGEMLGWDVLHRELLDHMAEKYNLPRHTLGMIDENTTNWLVEVFGKWLDPRLVTHSEYIVHLGQIVLLAAQNVSNVFVGRGAQFFLPPEKGIAIYLVAPLTNRIRHIREVTDCSEAAARRYIRETDRGRRDLIKKHFNKEIGDPHLYDLVINCAHTSIDEAAELVASQCRSRFAGL